MVKIPETDRQISRSKPTLTQKTPPATESNLELPTCLPERSKDIFEAIDHKPQSTNDFSHCREQERVIPRTVITTKPPIPNESGKPEGPRSEVRSVLYPTHPEAKCFDEECDEMRAHPQQTTPLEPDEQPVRQTTLRTEAKCYDEECGEAHSSGRSGTQYNQSTSETSQPKRQEPKPSSRSRYEDDGDY
jgi:hypothetical protein